MTIKKIIQLINDQKLLAFYDFLLIELDSIKEENKLKQKFEEYFKFYETKRNNLTPTNTDLDHKNNKAYKHPNETYVDHDKIHENHSQTKDNRETYENMVTKKNNITNEMVTNEENIKGNSEKNIKFHEIQKNDSFEDDLSKINEVNNKLATEDQFYEKDCKIE